MTAGRAPLGPFVAREHAAGRLVVQPRMGFAEPATMREGLRRTKQAAATSVGTLTLDSYTRVGDHVAAAKAVADGAPLNGYPLVAHGTSTTRRVLDGIADETFPVQVRHGSADPRDIFTAMIDAGLDGTEGGPVSYCLPYSRMPLRDSVDAWSRACDLLATVADQGGEPHLESFGGAMLGQLCPPSMLVALSVLECLFFAQRGIRSVSLSYAQQTNPAQDADAVRALRALAEEYLTAAEWHVVIYAYMGVYPRTPAGAARILRDASRLAVSSGAARLIVKTEAEPSRIPTIGENVAALESAAHEAHLTASAPLAPPAERDDAILGEAKALVEAVLGIDQDLAESLPAAFERGYLDIPFCLHPDNRGSTRGFIDADRYLRWSEVGSLPIDAPPASERRPLTAESLIAALSEVRHHYDELPARSD